MPQESLALPEVELPAEADYETVLDALMANERGRRFLAEFASRNRNADTAMLVGAIARVEAAVRGEPVPRISAKLASADLIEFAAAIERIETQLAGAGSQSSAVLAAVERIQDIAFVLHERPVETTLCDALDGAIRDISDAFARSDADRTAELLHALAVKVRAAMGSATQFMVTQSSDAVGHDEPPPESEAAVADAMPLTADAPERDTTQRAEDVVVQSADEEFHGPPAEMDTEGLADHSEPPLPLPTPEPIPTSSSADILSQAFGDGPVAGAQSPPYEEASNGEPPAEDLLPSQGYGANGIADPQDDPGDLFEEPVLVESADAAADVTAPPEFGRVARAPHPAVQPGPPPLRAAVPVTRPVPRPSASDPLAPVRALSEEELIALFS